MKTLSSVHHRHIKQALTIRAVEEKFLQLFSEGKLNGTVHTCVGQEFSALAFAGQLRKSDFIFSNHRCHGHYIAFTGDVKGLIAELLGKASGTCGGIGSSQHLCRGNFFSNGVQGGIVPVAAGYALGNKLKGNDNIGIVFIGDGTLGEGVLYETMNIISKWEIPLLIVCENNAYAQSTPQEINLAGDIRKRAEAFGIQTWVGTTEEPEELMATGKAAIESVRYSGRPGFFLVETYRLNPHSKGDDDRNPDEIERYRRKDFLHRFSENSSGYFSRYMEDIDREVEAIVDTVLIQKELPLSDYYAPENTGDLDDLQWTEIESLNQRMVERINGFFRKEIHENKNLLFIGEDVLSPYGGAFKVARDLSDIAPRQVFSTPISEAAITGIGNGLALNGFKPFVEIMFGDFITLAFDQVVNHASKFHHMFNKQVDCPVVIRTPMGGRRGYGPTHSQTLDKFLLGIDHVRVLALNTFIDPEIIFRGVMKEKGPVIVIENKIDYGKKILPNRLPAFHYQRSQDDFPVVHIRPRVSEPDITLLAYGGMSDIVHALLEELFQETDLKPELIVPACISTLPMGLLEASVAQTRRIAIIEEGSPFAGFGSEVIARLAENLTTPFHAKRIGALPVPIPSVKSLENAVLPGHERIIAEIKQYFC